MILLLSIFLLGLIMGPFMVLFIGKLLPDKWSEKVAKWHINTGIKMGHRWLLVEKGNGDYDLQMSTRDEEDEGEIVGEDVYPDPAGLMGRLFGKPFGVAYHDNAVVSSPLISKVGSEYGTLIGDGGMTHPEESRPLSWYRNNRLLARTVEGNKVLEVVNGAVDVPHQAIANVRDTVKLLSKGGDPGLAQRAATNAEQSEVIRHGDTSLRDAAGKFAYLMMGGLLVYIGTSGGSGGGGGVTDSVAGTVGMSVPHLLDGMMLIGGML